MKESFCTYIKFCYNNKQNCFKYRQKRISTKCDCFKVIETEESLEALSETIAGLVVASKDVRDKFTQDVIGGGYLVEKSQRKRNNECHIIDANNNLAFCGNTTKIILCVGRKRIDTIIANYATILPTLHGLSGKISNNNGANNIILKKDIEQFINTKANEIGESHATRFLREHHKIHIRDSEANTIELPSYFTKRRMCREYCYEKGWLAKTNGIGELKLTEREDADGICPILSWSSFLNVWDNACSHIRIRPPSRDTCDSCFKYKMIIKGLKQEELTNDDDNPNHESLAESATHIRQARAQRVYSDDKIRQCKEDYKNNLHFNRSNYVITFDFAQNLQLLHFGEEQPGDTYYFSPLSLHVFGIVNHSPEKDHLHGFLYHEGEGKKGSNNVASLVRWFLFDQIIPHDFIPFAQPLDNSITWICDNCTGQNKNNVVLRLANMLVEGGYFSKITICFLVKGHTKNSCDRNFNSMKCIYHSTNVCTKEEALDILSQSENITMVDVTPSFMIDIEAT